MRPASPATNTTKSVGRGAARLTRIELTRIEHNEITAFIAGENQCIPMIIIVGEAGRTPTNVLSLSFVAGITMTAFEGVWEVTDATLPDGTFAYTGTLTIAQRNDVYALDWDISAGRYVGIGLKVDDHLLVSCGEQFAGLGLALYQRGAEGMVKVTWTTAEMDGGLGSGQFTTTVGDAFVGDHTVIHTLPNGQFYGEWTLSVERSNGMYRLIWRKGNGIHWHGLGLDITDGLAVAWYPDRKQLALLDYWVDPHDPHIVHAHWALGDYDGLGGETLSRQAFE